MLPCTPISFFIDFRVGAQTRSDLNHAMRVVMNYLEDLKESQLSSESSVCGRGYVGFLFFFKKRAATCL